MVTNIKLRGCLSSGIRVVPCGRTDMTKLVVAFHKLANAFKNTFYVKSVIYICNKVKVKWSHYSPGVAQRAGRGIALLFHDRGTRRGGVVSSTPRPHFTPGKDPVPIVQEAGWAPVPVWTDGKSRPHWDSIPDRLARSQSLYRLSYRARIYRLWLWRRSSLCIINYLISVHHNFKRLYA